MPLESFLILVFFFFAVFFLSVFSLAHYHWSKFAQPGLRAKIFTYSIEGLFLLCLIAGFFFLY